MSLRTVTAGVSSVKGWKVVHKSLPRIIDYGRSEGILQATASMPGIVLAAHDAAHQKVNKDNKNGDKVNLPTNDLTLMHEAIPFLPLPIALTCLCFNILLPGSGTIFSGFAALCMGQPRVNIKEGRKLVTLFVNFIVGISQFFTITFLFVGWFWSIAWGGLLIIHAINSYYRLEYRVIYEAAAIEALTKDSILHRRDVKTLVKQHKDRGKEEKGKAALAAKGENGKINNNINLNNKNKIIYIYFLNIVSIMRLYPKKLYSYCSSPSSIFSLRTRNCGELRDRHVGERVKIYGWLATKRMNKFLLIKDAYGSVQAMLPENIRNLIKSLKEHSSIYIEGKVADRGEHKNDKMATGDIQIDVKKLEVLNSVTKDLPVFDNSNESTRLTYRYLDLRTEKMQNALRFRAKIISAMRRELESYYFIEVQTPTLSHFTPGGANEFIVPATKLGECFSLPQSPQIYKQLLMCGAIDRYYQIAICYRDEITKPNRQFEFTQLDLELSFTNQNEVMSLVENIIVNCWPSEDGLDFGRFYHCQDEISPDIPFPKLEYSEAMLKYGTDKPDLRIPWKIKNCPLLENSPKIKAKMFIAIGALKYLSKEKILRWEQKINLLPYKQNYSIICSESIDKFNEIKLNKEYILNNLNFEEDNDVIVVSWGDCEESILKVLGYLRNYLAESMSDILFKENLFKFVWINRFPLFLKNEETGEIESAHHPFTAPIPEHLEDLKNGKNLEKIEAQHYDLVLNGEEIGGGSIRIHNADLQEHKHLIEALRYGAPPHGGFALGLDRYIAILNAKGDTSVSIRNVIAFPKSASGYCYMTGSPAQPNEELLSRYGLERISKVVKVTETDEKENDLNLLKGSSTSLKCTGVFRGIIDFFSTSQDSAFLISKN
ncbi:Aspartyl-tRNA synthetase [Meloidogyne graminicola]|uniref:Aspartyl-tRNA synthetase n=1 Tax=Meloidogyne graminicola TaxID=189291 RepID=A0A8S9ZIZ2_9BILA|nr:Aspartyl-tRNA synthetase [Meloidogyne graminicola]